MAFQGPMAFSVAVDAFLESLHEDNQDTVYFTSALAGGAFIATGTVWSAPWQSNYAVCTPGYSTFIPQTAETGWAVEDIIFGDSRHFTTDQLVVNTQRRMKQLVGDQVYENVFHKPMGPNVHQGSLVRGDGLNQQKTGCHDKGFRRFTSQKLDGLVRRGVNCFIGRGPFGPFMQTWVFISHAKAPFDVVRMNQILQLTFAETLADAKLHFPLRDDKPDLGGFRKLAADFVIVGRLQNGQIWDISRNGMIKGVTEFTEFIFSQVNGTLGSLGGIPAARAAAKSPAAKAAAKAKSKSADTKRRRDSVNAFVNIYGAPPRTEVDASVAVDEAFGVQVEQSLEDGLNVDFDGGWN